MVTISNSSTSTKRSWFSGRNIWLLRILTALLVLWGIRVLFSSRGGWSLLRSSNDGPIMPLTDHKLIILQDNELAYMVPSSTVIGLLIFFHGCSHAAEDLFLLPEDRIVAAEALKRGLAVLSITSQDRETGCWSRKDVEELQQTHVVDNWLKKNNLPTNLPRIGMGASSGGRMVDWVKNVLNLKAMAVYIMALEETSNSLVDVDSAAIPTVFVHMPRDERTARRVKKQHDAFQRAGIPSLELEVEPHALTQQVCNQRLPELGARKCHKLLKSGIKHGFLDKDYNVLQPGVPSWEKVLQGELKLDAVLKKQRNPDVNFDGHSRIRAAVQEEIAVAYGLHEMTCEHASQVLDFLMKHAGITSYYY